MVRMSGYNVSVCNLIITLRLIFTTFALVFFFLGALYLILPSHPETLLFFFFTTFFSFSHKEKNKLEN